MARPSRIGANTRRAGHAQLVHTSRQPHVDMHVVKICVMNLITSCRRALQYIVFMFECKKFLAYIVTSAVASLGVSKGGGGGGGGYLNRGAPWGRGSD